MKLNWGQVFFWLLVIVWLGGGLALGLTVLGGNNGTVHGVPGNYHVVPGKQQPAAPPEEPPAEPGGGKHGK